MNKINAILSVQFPESAGTSWFPCFCFFISSRKEGNQGKNALRQQHGPFCPSMRDDEGRLAAAGSVPLCCYCNAKDKLYSYYLYVLSWFFGSLGCGVRFLFFAGMPQVSSERNRSSCIILHAMVYVAGVTLFGSCDIYVYTQYYIYNYKYFLLLRWMGKNKALSFHTYTYQTLSCFDLTHAPVATSARAAATGFVSMSTRRDPAGSGTNINDPLTSVS